MYTKGLCTLNIQDHFSDLYGTEVSSTVISNVTNKILPLVKEWQNRPSKAATEQLTLEQLSEFDDKCGRNILLSQKIGWIIGRN